MLYFSMRMSFHSRDFRVSTARHNSSQNSCTPSLLSFSFTSPNLSETCRQSSSLAAVGLNRSSGSGPPTLRHKWIFV